ncbi:MAG TPA: aldose epimerase [Rhodanobacteraceae bacterium]|nr:aldose epimerase [Rhodanobacteraceae bacterium]
MDRYTAERAMLGDQPIVVLADEAGHRVRVACHGAALSSLEVPRNGNAFDIAWGYRDAAEIRARKGSHFAILAPFGGRIGDARYRFDGHDYDLEPGVEGTAREFRHGFVRGVDFEIAELRAHDTAAQCTLATSAIRPRPGYPFSIDLGLTFTLDKTGLALEARMRNVGDRPAPCFFGWHAYFRAGDGKADDWMLEIPARTTIRTDDRLIALPGDAAYVPLDDAPALDFRKSRRIGDAVLDNGYTDLVSDDDGRIRTRLSDPANGFTVTVWQESGVMHAFTGDTLGAGARSAVALEPMEFMADAFNRPECADGIRLEPGAERSYRCGVEFTAR